MDPNTIRNDPFFGWIDHVSRSHSRTTLGGYRLPQTPGNTKELEGGSSDGEVHVPMGAPTGAKIRTATSWYERIENALAHPEPRIRLSGEILRIHLDRQITGRDRPRGWVIRRKLIALIDNFTTREGIASPFRLGSSRQMRVDSCLYDLYHPKSKQQELENEQYSALPWMLYRYLCLDGIDVGSNENLNILLASATDENVAMYNALRNTGTTKSAQPTETTQDGQPERKHANQREDLTENEAGLPSWSADTDEDVMIFNDNFPVGSIVIDGDGDGDVDVDHEHDGNSDHKSEGTNTRTRSRKRIRLDDKDTELQKKNMELEDKDMALEDKNIALEEANLTLNEQNMMLEERNIALADKNLKLREKVVELTGQLCELQNKAANDQKTIELEEKNMGLREKVAELTGQLRERKDKETNDQKTIEQLMGVLGLALSKNTSSSS